MPLNLQKYDLNIFDLSPRKQFNIPMWCVVKTLGVEHLSSEKILMLFQSLRALRRLKPWWRHVLLWCRSWRHADIFKTTAVFAQQKNNKAELLKETCTSHAILQSATFSRIREYRASCLQFREWTSQPGCQRLTSNLRIQEVLEHHQSYWSHSRTCPKCPIALSFVYCVWKYQHQDHKSKAIQLSCMKNMRKTWNFKGPNIAPIAPPSCPTVLFLCLPLWLIPTASEKSQQKVMTCWHLSAYLTKHGKSRCGPETETCSKIEHNLYFQIAIDSRSISLKVFWY